MAHCPNIANIMQSTCGLINTTQPIKVAAISDYYHSITEGGVQSGGRGDGGTCQSQAAYR